MFLIFCITLIEMIKAHFRAFITTAYKDIEKKKREEEEQKLAEDIDRQNAENRAKEAQAQEVWGLIDESQTVKDLQTRVRELEARDRALSATVDRLITCLMLVPIILCLMLVPTSFYIVCGGITVFCVLATRDQN